MARVFISYRRKDSKTDASRIHDQLTSSFGKKWVFMDTEGLYAGDSFKEKIKSLIQNSDVLLVIIGPTWFQELQHKWHSEKYDYVQFEIETAIKSNIEIIPVLVSGASVPDEARLPKSLQPLAGKHTIPVRQNPDFKKDIKSLINDILKFVPWHGRIYWYVRKNRVILTSFLLVLVLIFATFTALTIFFEPKPLVIKADPEGLGAKQITYKADDPYYRDEAIESVEYLRDTNEFRVTLKPGHSQGRFKAFHINKRDTTRYFIEYVVGRSGLVDHERIPRE